MGEDLKAGDCVYMVTRAWSDSGEPASLIVKAELVRRCRPRYVSLDNYGALEYDQGLYTEADIDEVLDKVRERMKSDLSDMNGQSGNRWECRVAGTIPRDGQGWRVGFEMTVDVGDLDVLRSLEAARNVAEMHLQRRIQRCEDLIGAVRKEKI